MPVFVYDQNGLVESASESEWKALGHVVHAYNLQNPGQARKLLIGPSFPPADHVFDESLGDIRPKKLSEKLNDGEITLTEGATIVVGPQGESIVMPGQRLTENGSVVEKSIEEKIAEGLTPFDPTTQKIENGVIVAKSQQDLFQSGQITAEQIVEQTLGRLRAEIEQLAFVRRTPSGHHIDNLARQKAAFSMQYRHVPDNDPVKLDLSNRKLIYTNSIVDEILAELEKIQIAYDAAKSDVLSILNQNQANVVELLSAVHIANYLDLP